MKINLGICIHEMYTLTAFITCVPMIWESEQHFFISLSKKVKMSLWTVKRSWKCGTVACRFLCIFCFYCCCILSQKREFFSISFFCLRGYHLHLFFIRAPNTSISKKKTSGLNYLMHMNVIFSIFFSVCIFASLLFVFSNFFFMLLPEYCLWLFRNAFTSVHIVELYHFFFPSAMAFFLPFMAMQ